jgi:hypothetical protein
MLRAGLTIEQVCADPSFEISRKTFYAWCKKHPSLKKVLDEGGNRGVADYMVEDACFRRATGWEWIEKKIKYETHVDDDGNEKRVEVERTETTKLVLPDPASFIFWLKNRKPNQWKDKPDGGGDEHAALDALKAFRRAMVSTHGAPSTRKPADGSEKV